jgi:hypothetical protein
MDFWNLIIGCEILYLLFLWGKQRQETRVQSQEAQDHLDEPILD